MNENQKNNMQLLINLNKQLDIQQKLVENCLSKIFVEGESLKVKRNGVWQVKFVGADSGQYAGYFRAKSKTGKIHTFHFNEIIID